MFRFCSTGGTKSIVVIDHINQLASFGSLWTPKFSRFLWMHHSTDKMSLKPLRTITLLVNFHGTHCLSESHIKFKWKKSKRNVAPNTQMLVNLLYMEIIQLGNRDLFYIDSNLSRWYIKQELNAYPPWMCYRSREHYQYYPKHCENIAQRISSRNDTCGIIHVIYAAVSNLCCTFLEQHCWLNKRQTYCLDVKNHLKHLSGPTIKLSIFELSTYEQSSKQTYQQNIGHILQYPAGLILWLIEASEEKTNFLANGWFIDLNENHKLQFAKKTHFKIRIKTRVT